MSADICLISQETQLPNNVAGNALDSHKVMGSSRHRKATADLIKPQQQHQYPLGLHFKAVCHNSTTSPPE